MMKFLKSGFSLFVAVVLFSGHSSFAQTTMPSDSLKGDPYYQIGSVETKVIEVDEQEVSPNQMPLTALHSNYFDVPTLQKNAAGVDPLAIADILIKIWNIISENKPVANVASKTASALPNLANNDWRSLVGWKPERSVKFALEIKNGFGMTVVGLHYNVRLFYGGQVKGKGHYIGYAQVMPTDVTVLWAYNLDVSVNVASVYNAGSEVDPMGAIALDVQYKYGNMLAHHEGSDGYLLQADGLIKDRNSNKVYFAGTTKN